MMKTAFILILVLIGLALYSMIILQGRNYLFKDAELPSMGTSRDCPDTTHFAPVLNFSNGRVDFSIASTAKSLKSQDSVGCIVRNTWDIPNIRLTCQQAVDINADLSMDQMLDYFYDRFLMRRHVECHQAEWIGNTREGGWNVCTAPPYTPKEGCLVYSVGIAGDWSFDDNMYKRFGCHVYSFDPSIGKSDHNRSAGVSFFKVGLAGKTYINDKKWSMKSWRQILLDTGHLKDDIDYLKFDIEESEWVALETAIRDGSLLRVKQIGFEAHCKKTDKKEKMLKWYHVLSSLEQIGFQMWSHDINPLFGCFKSGSGQQHCPLVNVHYINLRFLREHLFT